MEDKVGFVVHKNNISKYGLYVETLLGSITHTHTYTNTLTTLTSVRYETLEYQYEILMCCYGVNKTAHSVSFLFLLAVVQK